MPSGDKWPRAHANDNAAMVRLIFALFGKVATAPEPAATAIPAPVGPVNAAAAVEAIKALYTALTGQPFPH